MCYRVASSQKNVRYRLAAFWNECRSNKNYSETRFEEVGKIGTATLGMGSDRDCSQLTGLPGIYLH
jgi:hypothetical protein